jgi:predicted esterase
MRGPLIIWLHGLGDSGMGWSFLRQEMRLPSAVQYKFPDAPEAPVTCNGGYVMTSWMDLETIPIGNDLPDDVQGLSASSKIIHEIIDKEVSDGTPSENIVLGGFSQGGAMALLAGYSYGKPLAGVACLSGWPALRETLADRVAKGANAKTPLFIGHGTEDQTVYPECGADARDRFKAAGVDVTFMDYPAAHGSHPAGMAGLRAWFVDVLKVQE